jgi:tetratricopeptide (TPR) repeat protein
MKDKVFFEKMGQKSSLIFWLVAGLMLVLMLIGSQQAGMSGDEKDMMLHAQKVLNFWKTGGEDTSAVVASGRDGNSQLYGQTPDNLALLISKAFNIENELAVRHFIVAICGWLAILFVGLLVFRISGKRYAAIVAMLLLFLSPRFLGHSFNNTKDIPFAAMIMMGTYFIYRFLTTFPKPKILTCIMLAISIGFAIGIRVPGLLLIAYFALFAIVFWLNEWLLRKNNAKKAAHKKTLKKASQNDKNTSVATPVPTKSPLSALSLSQIFGKLFIYGIIISLAGYLLAVLIWPYAWVAPIENVSDAFSSMSKFAISIRQLFEGQFTMSNSLPWYYTPKYILMTTPIAVALGALIYLFFGGLKRTNWFSSFVVYFAFVFPIFWIIYSNANVYGGWRHAIFAYPAMVVAAGLGFNALVEWAKNKYLKIAFIVLPFALLIMPAIHIVKNHPHEYVYFNTISGGINNAYGNYEMDYYYHSTRAATDWVIKNAQKSGMETGDKILVGSWHALSTDYFFRHDTDKFQSGFVRWRERSTTDWDYAIFTITGIAPQIIKSPHFPPANTVHTINVDGKPICLILKRKDKFGFQAEELRQKLNDTTLTGEQRNELYINALNKFKQAYQSDPYDEVILTSLAEMFLMGNQIDSSKFYVDKLIELYPADDQLSFASNMYFQYANRTNSQQLQSQGIAFQEQMIAQSPRNSQNYYNLAMLYARMGNVARGAKLMEDCLKINSRTFEANYYVAIYHAQTGNRNEAVNILEKCLKKFPSHADEVQNVLNQINGVR